MEWSPSLPSIYYVGLAAGLFAALVLARQFATVRTARSLLLLGLRAAVLAILFVILLEPVRVTETQLPDEPPKAVYLVDRSRSMALDGPFSRLNQARRVITMAEAKLPYDTRPKIELFSFGDDLQPFLHVGAAGR